MGRQGESATRAPAQGEAPGRARRRGAGGGGNGEPMNFRVDPDFRRRFRLYAVNHGMKLTEVLLAAFEALEREAGHDPAPR